MHSAEPPLRIEQLLRHRKWVRSFARALVWGDQDVDDLEQETWLASLEAPEGMVASPKGWLATVLRRTALRKGARDQRRHEIERLSPRTGDVAAAPDVLAQAELQERVVRSVLNLA